MQNEAQHEFLLATNEQDLRRYVEPALRASGAEVEVVGSAEATIAALESRPRTLVLIDAELPGMEIGRLLAAMQGDGDGVLPIVLFSDTLTAEFGARMREGVVADVLPRNLTPESMQLRAEMALQAHRNRRELAQLRQAAAVNAQGDLLTGTYNRTALLSMLFRETDRVQRMNSELSLILLDVDDFGHWNVRLGSEACDELLVQTADRTKRLLRSYDLLGRMGKDEFLIALPGCSGVNAVLLAERIRQDAFAVPFRVAGKSIRLSACFAVASSHGRSPVVVLREIEEALMLAKRDGPESIRRAAECPPGSSAPIAFVSPSSGDDLLAW